MTSLQRSDQPSPGRFVPDHHVSTKLFPTHHVPSGHGQSLIEPPLDQLPDWIRSSHFVGRSLGSNVEFCGTNLPEFRRLARRSAVALAAKYTLDYRTENLPDVSNIDSLIEHPIVMSGHQPELFHCGVWFKNFLLSNLAQASGAIGIHFLVDNDLCRSTSIPIPKLDGSNERSLRCSDPNCTTPFNGECNWSMASVPFDAERDAVPWENALVRDLDLWSTFPQRIQSELPPLLGQPLVDRLWKYAAAEASIGKPLGVLLSRARHQLEAEFGLQTLEVPLSQLSETEEFARFSVQLLSELPRLHEIYNKVLNEYRAVHRIRNHAQPLPNLGDSDDWLEAPWWVYRRDSQSRDPVWVRCVGKNIILSNRTNWQATIDVSGTCQSAAAQWLDILRGGICLRPRALLTTMYARLILSDLFIHGVGGARYDQLTDRIIADFFGLETPPLCLASITLHLPFQNLARQLTEPAGERLVAAQQKLRVSQSNPEAAFDDGSEPGLGNAIPEVRELIAQKKQLLANIPPRGEKWQWHSELKAVNEQLGILAEPNIARIQHQIESLKCLQSQQQVVLARNFSYCLFPSETIQEAFQRSLR